MRQFLLGLSISIAFIVGCVTPQHVPGVAMSSASASAPTPAYVGPRWEYTCQAIPNAVFHKADFNAGGSAEAASEFLKPFGADGWEIVPFHDAMPLTCFKRPG
jgi:hypothetical protein